MMIRSRICIHEGKRRWESWIPSELNELWHSADFAYQPMKFLRAWLKR